MTYKQHPPRLLTVNDNANDVRWPEGLSVAGTGPCTVELSSHGDCIKALSFSSFSDMLTVAERDAQSISAT